MKTLIISLLIGLFANPENTAPAIYNLDNTNSDITVSGTSTMHDWDMKAEKMKGSLNADLSGDSPEISNLKLVVEAKSLKSGKSGMDDNAYKALNAKSHPQITYELTQLKNVSTQSAGRYKAVSVGKLSVAGKTQQLSVPVIIRKTENGIVISGDTSFKMSQFGIDPPSFMFGSVTTGDEVTIKFNLNYKS